MLEVNLTSPVPIYEQVADEVKKMIRGGELKVGDTLPPIRTLANQLDVSVNTVARAYQELYNQGLIEGNRRKGSYVRQSVPDRAHHDSRVFKDPILTLVRQGLNRDEIEHFFAQSISEIFD